MGQMPKWLIPVIVATWVGGGVAAYYGQWVPVLLLFALGILAATSGLGVLYANRKAMRMVRDTVRTEAGTAPAAGTGESAVEAASRRREEAKRRHNRNKKRRRKS